MNLNWCRACLKKEDRLSSFQDNGEIIQAFLDLANIFIEPSCEKLPLLICDQCLTKIHECSEFRREIIANNAFLLKILEGSFSTEELDTALQQHWNLSISQTEDKSAHNKQETDENVKENTEPDGQEVVVETLISNAKDVKDEFYLPETEVFDAPFAAEYCEDDNNVYKKEKQKRNVKRTLRNKKKSNSVSPEKKARPRTFLEVDPNKITILERTAEEQMSDQRAEGLKQSYLSMPYKCEKCFKGFNFDRKLKSHDLNYHKPASPFTCSVCTRTMSSSESLRIHLKKHQLLYQCNVCYARFAEKPRAISHYASIHEGVQQEYPCKHCDVVFTNRSSLNGHTRNHHPTTERPKCQVCLKTFATTDSLKDHALIHTGEKNYACQVCDKRFRLRQSVVKHMLSHSTLRAHYCIPCDASFKSNAALASHLRYAAAHASPRLLKQNTCEKCGRSFSLRHRLLIHMSRHAGTAGPARRPAATKVRYVCHQCGRGFAARGTLSNHLLTHSGARPHACRHCAARFAQLTTLRTHLHRVHPGDTQH